MKMRLFLSMSLALAMVPGSGQAQSTLDKYLKKNSTAGSGESNADEAGINKVYTSGEGYWRLDDNRSTGGFCAITYVTPAYYVGYLGPTGAATDAYILFDGPTIPPTKKAKRKTVTLTPANGAVHTIPAIHQPSSTHKDMGTLRFTFRSIQPAMDEMNDIEHLTIVMDKKQVFSIKWKGGHAARDAMQKCLSGTPSAGAK
jgi:hypothetical protein